jgi:hypothetical protein
MMRPEQIHYDAVETWIRESIATGRDFLFDHRLFREELTRTWDKFDFPYEVCMLLCMTAWLYVSMLILKTEAGVLRIRLLGSVPLHFPQSLHSFIRNLHVIHVKKTAPAVKESLAVYLDEYKNGRTIKELAKRANFPPYLFSRYVVEAVAVTTGLNSKKGLTKAMKDPMNELGTLDKIAPEYHASEKQFAGDAASSTTTRLAIQVKEAIDSDPMYGPQHDKERHIVGVEYEVVLEHYLLETGKFQNPSILVYLIIGSTLTVPHRSTGQAFRLKQKPSFEIAELREHQTYY